MRFWLSDDSTTVDLGDEVKEITLGESERSYEIARFARSNGGYLRGIGNYSPKKFEFLRDDYITQTAELHAWNEQRNNFMLWFTKPVYKDVYLNMQYSTDTIELRTLVYPLKLPSDKFSETWNTNFNRSFEMISPSGTWQNTSATTGTTAIGSTSEQAVDITNDGILECTPIFSFTPDGAGTIFQVKLADGYMFRLEGTFSSGVAIDYYMLDGTLKINNAMVDATNYLTAGSPFSFPAGSTSVFVTASVGTFGWDFNEKYV